MAESTKGVAVVIAPLDPSGSSGLLLCSRLITEAGLRAMGVSSAGLVADTGGVRRIEAAQHELLSEQLPALFSDVEVAAVVIGALPTIECAGLVADAVAQTAAPVVWNAQFVANNGVPLVVEPVEAIAAVLLPVVDLLVASVADLALVGALSTNTDWKASAEELSRRHRFAALVAGDALLRDRPEAGKITWQLAGVSGSHEREMDCGECKQPLGLREAIATTVAVELSLGQPIEEATRSGLEQVGERWRSAETIGRGAPVLQ